MSNYPPGVTGNEYQIAGGRPIRPIHEHVQHECDPEKFEEDFEGEVLIDDVEVFNGIASGFFTCPQCGKTDIEWVSD